MSKFINEKGLFMDPKVEQHGSHMVMTNVHKPTKIQYLNMDTIFTDDLAFNATHFNSISNYTFSLPHRIDDIKSITVVSAEIPVSFYIISADAGNNYFKIINSSKTEFMIIIEDGNYSIDTLTVEINRVLTETGITDIVFTDKNRFAYFTASTNVYSLHFDVDITGSFDKYMFKSKLGWLLGFRGQVYTLSTYTIKSESFINIIPSPYLYISIDEHCGGFPNSFTSPLADSIINKKILARVSVDQHFYPFGSVAHTSSIEGTLVSDIRRYSGKINIQKLSVQLIDAFGKNVNLNGLDFSFILKIEYE
jgi:hypothetical protein